MQEQGTFPTDFKGKHKIDALSCSSKRMRCFCTLLEKLVTAAYFIEIIVFLYIYILSTSIEYLIVFLVI
jgi:hypothetical protein